MRPKRNSDINLQRLKYFSTLLKETRINGYITQRQLSENSNLHVNTIKKIENSDFPHNVTLLTILELADALQVSPVELFIDMN